MAQKVARVSGQDAESALTPDGKLARRLESQIQILLGFTSLAYAVPGCSVNCGG
jgi:hypothetical protein